MSNAKAQLTFYGGAGSVTGANFLLEIEGTKILVDCGLEQGERFCVESNWDKFPYDPKSIDYLFITHAHADHMGRMPKLVRDGFVGTIYSTPGTMEITKVMLEDSVSLIKEEADDIGREPLYEEKDIAKTLSLWKTIPYHKETALNEDIKFNFKDAGHILGSAMIEFLVNDKKIVFTGDLGNSPSPLLRNTEKITDANYLIMESVYGDRFHESVAERTELLEDAIERAITKEGALLIPAFSIERTQVILYELNRLVEEHKIRAIPVFLDSPLAIKITDIYRKQIKNFKNTVQEEIKSGDDIFNFPKLQLTRTANESKRISEVGNPKIIIAGSGMSSGGRILHHEKRHLSDPNSTLLLVGYQAVGSLGRKLQDGVQEVEIFDEQVKVNASVRSIRGYSAHKDSEGLFHFVEGSADHLQKVFCAMGEPKSSLFLVQKLRDYLGLDAVAPQKGEHYQLEL